MSGSDLIDVKDVRSALEELCARNVAVDLHYESEPGKVHTARIRLLQLDDEVICTDKPQNIDEGVDLRDGQRIRVYYVQDNSRWAFDSRIVKLSRIVRLNSRQRVLGMAIALPHEVLPLQRRRDYRVPIASKGISCQLVSQSADEELTCDCEAKHLQALLANVSVRGASVVLRNERPRNYPFGRRFFLDFNLPEIEHNFLILAEIRHAHEVPGRARLILGLRFLLVLQADERLHRTLINRYVVSEQRRKLRRKR